MDNLDMRILSRLLNNCREPDRQIGKELGVSGGAVHARIQKMEEAGVIEKFLVKIEPPVLGYGILYVVVSDQNIDEILGQVRLIGEPFFVVPCIGGVTVCSIVVKGDLQHKVGLAGKMMKGAKILSIFEAENPGFSSNLTRTDLEILGHLVADPRQRIESIARSTGMSTKTVTRCIEKMHENEGIQFTLVYEPKKIDGFIPHVVLAWIDGDLKQMLAKLNAEFSGSYLQIPFISKNQIVLFLYSDSIFGMDELAERVRATRGVKSADLFIPKKITFYKEWIKKAVKSSKKSPRLHLSYQAN
ncbi:MAG: AsnC family transcriptional regulator [Nitrosopumilus sp. H8]|nr:MAG: AsnC family transcriptional regulator [Nitrosopumilus sp. H13]RNJ78035.1 MAG: AsnC family transcriptional regulator [Nitrosopumilus sp. H8]